jgi:predicted AAA+ superfamily ATPase
MMIDAFPEKNIILTGSSSLDLSNKIGEPLTGRHFTLTLLPFSQREMNVSRFEIENNLEKFLIYGSYPEVLMSLRDDIGALWENFIFMELIKKSNIAGSFDNYYFWRTHTGQEIDIIKESNGALSAIECKWSSDKASIPSLWKETYPNTIFEIINKNNYLDFLISESDKV